MDNMEIWLDILGYESLYQISNFGNIKNSKNKILKGCGFKNGYRQVVLCKNNIHKSYYIHQLVAKHFLPNPNNYIEVNHINEIKTDNNVLNLEWCSHKYNCYYSETWEKISKKCFQYNKNGTFVNVYPSILDASKKTNISDGNINQCCLNKRKTAGGFIWKYAN